MAIYYEAAERRGALQGISQLFVDLDRMDHVCNHVSPPIVSIPTTLATEEAATTGFSNVIPLLPASIERL